MASIRPMSATRRDLLKRLEHLNIATETIDHPAVYTVEEAKALRGELVGTHSKNLFFKDKKGRFWLVVTHEDKVIDLKVLRKTIGAAQLSFGKTDVLIEKLGIEPGSVTPFSIINDPEQDVTLVLDADLLALEPLNFHPLINTATMRVSSEGLLAFVRDCGHVPVIVPL